METGESVLVNWVLDQPSASVPADTIQNCSVSFGHLESNQKGPYRSIHALELKYTFVFDQMTTADSNC
jgi:hypothetical protein